MEGTQIAFIVFSVCTFILLGFYWFGLRRKEKLGAHKKGTLPTASVSEQDRI